MREGTPIEKMSSLDGPIGKSVGHFLDGRGRAQLTVGRAAPEQGVLGGRRKVADSLESKPRSSLVSGQFLHPGSRTL